MKRRLDRTDLLRDPAVEVLRSIGAKNILVAGRATDCGQKVHNLAYAVTHAAQDAGIHGLFILAMSSAGIASWRLNEAFYRNIVERQAELQDFSLAATMVEQAHEESEGPSIEDAEIVVAGGRGLGSPEAF